MSEIEKPFARWENFAACEREMMDAGHDKDSADKICGSIQARAEKGMLYKSIGTLEILKSEGNELIVGGPATWDLVDPENDWITPQGMRNFLTKFFKLPEEYRNISIDHESLIIAKALLRYPQENPRYFSHVHEKGMYLISKIRDDDLSYTKQYRQLIKDGVYKMYSIRGKAINPQMIQKDGRTVRKIDDIDPIEVAIVKEGMNPKAGPIEVLKQLDIQKPGEEKPPKDWWDACISHVKGGDPAAICGHIFFHILGGDRSRADPSMFEKDLLNLDYIAKDMTWEECIEAASKNPNVTDPEKLCGWLRAHGPNAKTADKPADLPFQQEVEKIFRKHFPNYKSDQK